MNTQFVEVTNGFNWGKFMVGQFDREEWRYEEHVVDNDDPVNVPRRSLLAGRGWGPDHRLILDLQTGEGAMFSPGGHPPADLDKHRIWVCPMFEPFLEWLYSNLDKINDLPPVVELTEEEAPSSMHGYRRPGPEEANDLAVACPVCGGSGDDPGEPLRARSVDEDV